MIPSTEHVLLDTPPFDPVLYRDAMSRYAGHVQIITTALDDQRRGVTITAACSVSDNPASVLACLNNGNPKNEIFFKSGIFALNTLGFHHQVLADAFAGRPQMDTDARFAMAQWQTIATGAPVLSDAIVSFDCRLTDTKVTATHTVLFGEVVGLHFNPGNQSLIYLDRGYWPL